MELIIEIGVMTAECTRFTQIRSLSSIHQAVSWRKSIIEIGRDTPDCRGCREVSEFQVSGPIPGFDSWSRRDECVSASLEQPLHRSFPPETMGLSLLSSRLDPSPVSAVGPFTSFHTSSIPHPFGAEIPLWMVGHACYGVSPLVTA